jgi:hypothetical protein
MAQGVSIINEEDWAEEEINCRKIERERNPNRTNQAKNERRREG